MKTSPYHGEALSSEARTEVDLMNEIDRLFKDLNESGANEERRSEIAGEIRDALKRYRQFFGQDKEAMAAIDDYYARLEKDRAVAA